MTKKSGDEDVYGVPGYHKGKMRLGENKDLRWAEQHKRFLYFEAEKGRNRTQI